MSDASPRFSSRRTGGLVELVEPLFLYVCRLNRVARSHGQVSTRTAAPFVAHTTSFEQTRTEILRVLTTMRDEAASDVALARQFDAVELPLIFFVDSVIAESQLPFRDRWNENRIAATERGELGGDDKFFDMLDECLADASEEATERLVVYFTCLGLGFMGRYVGDQLQIDTRLQRITHRIRRKWLARDFEKRLTPQCYEHTDRSNLPKPSRDSLTKIIVVWGFGLVALFCVYFFSYQASSDKLVELVDHFAGQQAAATQVP